MEKDSTIDLSLSKQPGQSVWRHGKKEWESHMPKILMSIAPSSGFDTKSLWEKTQSKEREIDAANAVVYQAPVEVVASVEDNLNEVKKRLKTMNLKDSQQLIKDLKLTKSGNAKELTKFLVDYAIANPDKVVPVVLKTDQTDSKKSESKKSETKKSGKEEIIVNQEIVKFKKDYSIDSQQINNKKSSVATLISIIPKMQTALAKLEILLEILAIALKDNDRSLAYDVYWAIEKNKEYQEAKAAKLSATTPTTDDPYQLLIDKFQKTIEAIQIIRNNEEDLISYQLKRMADRLPPLSKFQTTFKLDPWQIRVLDLIDHGKSVVISAPTSSGKTVISTYVASLYKSSLERKGSKTGGVLFVVPTEPLVWQVAAHFAKYFNTSDSSDIALVTNQMVYSPNQDINTPPFIVVGTPLALESQLFKIRGKVTLKEVTNHVDRGLLPYGFHHYSWCVYDEVHSLEGEEGAALQRIIRLMKCNFLALSATIGNAEVLRSWMEHVKGEQNSDRLIEAINVYPPHLVNTTKLYSDLDRTKSELTKVTQEIATLHKYKQMNASIVENQVRLRNQYNVILEQVRAYEATDNTRLVQLHEHNSRFMNLQRHMWKPHTSTPEDGGEPQTTFYLQHINPLGAVDLEFLKRDGFKSAALPMTPLDMYNLWEGMQQVFPMPLIQHLSPNIFFERPKSERITLQDAKVYEDKLKETICQLAQDPVYDEPLTKLLGKYNIVDLPEEYDICELCLSLREQDMLPAVLFHLNPFELISLFKQLLGGVEKRQKAAYPHFYTDKENELNAHRNANLMAVENVKKDKDKEEIERELTPVASTIDYSQPHMDFVFNLSNQITPLEIEDILKDIIHRDKFEIISAHALIRGLRRGIGIYINDSHLTYYRLAVMRLATQGKLKLILSDSSLAYGVNMPFRTCVYCGEMGGQLDTLIAQQMAGRSGRRGLETEGHMVYVGSSSKFIKNLMLAKIPALHGQEPREITQFVPEMLLKYSTTEKFPCNNDVYSHQSDGLSGITLEQYAHHTNQQLPQFQHLVEMNTLPPSPLLHTTMNFKLLSRDVLLQLNLIEECNESEENISKNKLTYELLSSTQTPTGYRARDGCTSALWCLWEMRSTLPEALVFTSLLPDIYDEFIASKRQEEIATPDAELRFLLFMMLISDRHHHATDATAGYYSTPLLDHPYFASKPDLHEKIIQFQNKMSEVQNRLLQFPDILPIVQLSVSPLSPIDATLFDCILYPHNVSLLSTKVKSEIRERLTNLTKFIFTIHNTLSAPYKIESYNSSDTDRSKYVLFETLTRKSSTRIWKYICKDLIYSELNFVDVTDHQLERKHEVVPPLAPSSSSTNESKIAK